MINTLLGKVFGTKNERELKRLMPRVEAISALEPQMQQLSDDQLRAKTDEFRQRIQERLATLPDEPDADPDRLKQLEDERTKLSTKRWMSFWWKPLPWSAKLAAGCSTCATSTCS